MRGEPLFVHGEDGLTVLDTVPDSQARSIGIRPGDVLLSLYGMPLTSDAELIDAITYSPRNFVLRWRRDGREMQAQASFGDGERRLGVILAPRGNEEYVELETKSFGLVRWIKSLISRWRH
jgi:hypothetical protein